jgi:hypothetical protein
LSLASGRYRSRFCNDRMLHSTHDEQFREAKTKRTPLSLTSGRYRSRFCNDRMLHSTCDTQFREAKIKRTPLSLAFGRYRSRFCNQHYSVNPRLSGEASPALYFAGEQEYEAGKDL